MPRFLAAHTLPTTGPDTTWRKDLTRLATIAHDMGVRPIETYYSHERMRAYTIYDAADAQTIQRAHERARLTRPDEIVEVEQIYTELLAEPRRERFA